MLGLATKQDVRDSERRILNAIETSNYEGAHLDRVLRRARHIEKRVRQLARRLGKLDAST